MNEKLKQLKKLFKPEKVAREMNTVVTFRELNKHVFNGKTWKEVARDTINVHRGNKQLKHYLI